jgi:ABC-type multidrug transport system fused ATPase/permease subunit
LPLKEKLATDDKELRKRREAARSMKALALEQYINGSGPYSEVEKQDNIIYDTCDEYSEMINGANSIISYTNTATLVLVIMLVQNANIRATIIAVMSFGQTIDNLMDHMTWLTRTDTMIDDFNDRCNKFIRIQKPAQKPLPNSFKVTNVNIPRGERKVCYQAGVRQLEIKHGAKILLRGPSGAGKTTFMKGLLGQLDGVFINGIIAAHFMENFVWVGQKITGKFEELTVEQYFFGSDSDKKKNNSNRKKKNSNHRKRKNSRERTIEYFCKMAMLDGWIAKMKASSSES